MPIYTFECPKCGKVAERIYHIDKCPKAVLCDCGKKAKKIITFGGGIRTDSNAMWLPSVVEQMKPDYETQPVETRTQFKNYLDSHGLVWTG